MKNFFNRLLKIISPKTSYIIKSRIKFKSDSIHCILTEGNKWGVLKINDSGIEEELIAPVYDSAEYNSDHDLILAANYLNGTYTEGKNSYCLFDTNGLQIAAIENIDAIIFEKFGAVLVINKKRCGALDGMFQVAIPCEYALLTALSHDHFHFEKWDADQAENNPEVYGDSNGIINIENKILIQFDFTMRAFGPLYKDAVIIGTDSSYLIDKEYFSYNIRSKVKTVLPFEKILDTQPCDDQFNSETFFRTITEIDDKENYPENIWQTGMDDYTIGKWGVIFPNGEVAIPNEYENLERISAGYFKVGIGIPKVTTIENSNVFSLENIKWGLIGIDNKMVLNAEFDWIEYDKQRQLFRTNKGGLIKRDYNAHKPEWEIEGGEFLDFSPKH